MRTIINIFLIVFSVNTFAQDIQFNDPRLQPYVGTWTAQYDQNKVFELTLWQEHEVLKGSYKFTILDGSGSAIKTFKSNFPNSNFPNNEWPSVIYGRATNLGYIYGSVNDNTVYVLQNPSDRRGKPGDFKMTLQDGTTPVTAHWTVEDNRHVVLEGYPEHFSIPTDIVLTKEE